MAKTIAAISTGLAPGGIGVVRISGDSAVDIAARVFVCRDGSDLTALGGYRAKFGSVMQNGSPFDDAVALVFRAPKSYTGEDVVELSVHGGILSVKKTLEAVLKAGAEAAQAGEFTKRAFLNGKMDLTQAESVADIISARGEAELKASCATLQGRLSRSVNAVLETLLDVSSSMAAWVDYPDEEIPDLSEEELLQSLQFACDELKKLLRSYDKGQLVKNGIATAIVGRPNVGKSSLMNMLTGTEKSIVTHIEGTTRDIVEESVSLGNTVLRLMDTAGLRDTGDVVESIGIEKAYQALDNAALVLAVFDSSEELTAEDRDLIQKCSGKTCIAVINKTDIQCADMQEIYAAFDRVAEISAKNDEGLEVLEDAITSLLGVADFDASAPLLANSRQKQHCERALESVEQALEGAAAGVTYDAVNVMIDAAADELLALTGKKASAEVVNHIFAKFCVGK